MTVDIAERNYERHMKPNNAQYFVFLSLIYKHKEIDKKHIHIIIRSLRRVKNIMYFKAFICLQENNNLWSLTDRIE